MGESTTKTNGASDISPSEDEGSCPHHLTVLSFFGFKIKTRLSTTEKILFLLVVLSCVVAGLYLAFSSWIENTKLKIELNGVKGQLKSSSEKLETNNKQLETTIIQLEAEKSTTYKQKYLLDKYDNVEYLFSVIQKRKDSGDWPVTLCKWPKPKEIIEVSLTPTSTPTSTPTATATATATLDTEATTSTAAASPVSAVISDSQPLSGVSEVASLSVIPYPPPFFINNIVGPITTIPKGTSPVPVDDSPLKEMDTKLDSLRDLVTKWKKKCESDWQRKAKVPGVVGPTKKWNGICEGINEVRVAINGVINFADYNSIKIFSLDEFAYTCPDKVIESIDDFKRRIKEINGAGVNSNH